jgi:hypothetical protein
MGMRRRRGGGRSSRRRWKEKADTLSTQQTLLFLLPAVHIIFSFGSSSSSSSFFFVLVFFPTPVTHSFPSLFRLLYSPSSLFLISSLHHLYHSHSRRPLPFYLVLPSFFCGIVPGGSRCNRGLFCLFTTLSGHQRGSKGFEAERRRSSSPSFRLSPSSHTRSSRSMSSRALVRRTPPS